VAKETVNSTSVFTDIDSDMGSGSTRLGITPGLDVPIKQRLLDEMDGPMLEPCSRMVSKRCTVDCSGARPEAPDSHRLESRDERFLHAS
jgi:hypothetical protein